MSRRDYIASHFQSQALREQGAGGAYHFCSVQHSRATYRLLILLFCCIYTKTAAAEFGQLTEGDCNYRAEVFSLTKAPAGQSSPLANPLKISPF